MPKMVLNINDTLDMFLYATVSYVCSLISTSVHCDLRRAELDL